jgi:vacuolar-type H+-ATPase subunit D/Vma8
MVDNFNKKYKTLNTPQKNLLKEYINNISNTNSLREFVNDEVQNIKTTLESHVPNISDDITRIKLQEAVNQIENLTKGRIVKDKQVISLMRYYELIKELDNVRSK